MASAILAASKTQTGDENEKTNIQCSTLKFFTLPQTATSHQRVKHSVTIIHH